MDRTINYNRYLVLSTLLALKATSKKMTTFCSDFFFILRYLSQYRITYENPKSSNYLRTGSASEGSRSDEEKKWVEREEKSGLPQDRRIHYPGLLVILEREACARCAREYKTRGSWVPGTLLFLPLLLFFFSSAVSSPRLFWPLDTCFLRFKSFWRFR